MDPLAQLEVVTVNYRSGAAVARLVHRLGLDGQVVIVDNSSETGDLDEQLQSQSAVEVVRTEGNVGFAAAANTGFHATNQPYIAFCNPDATPTRADLARLVMFLAEHPDHGACGPALIDARGRLVVGCGGWHPSLPRVFAQALGLYLLFPNSGIALKPRPGVTYDVGWVAGTCLLVRRQAFQEVGGFDPSYFLYQEDVDLGRRFTKGGWCLAVVGDVRVGHTEGTSALDVDRRWLVGVRAEALARYLERTLSGPQACIARMVLTLGYLARAVVHAVRGRSGRARDMLGYSRGLTSQHPPRDRR